MYRKANDLHAGNCEKLRNHLENKNYRNVKVLLLLSIQ